MTIKDYLEKKILENKAELDKCSQKLEKSIIELSNLIKSENKQSENKQPERWKPSKGKTYKSILSDGFVGEYQFIGDPIDQKRIKFGNAFPLGMPLDNVVMMHQFINEMELILWQLGISSSQDADAYVIQSKCGKICYRFYDIDQRDKAKSMLSDKVKEWLGI